MVLGVVLVSTGGTIEKTYDELGGMLVNYDELGGMLVNKVSNLDVVLARIVVHGVQLVRVPLLNKDSRDMSDFVEQRQSRYER